MILLLLDLRLSSSWLASQLTCGSCQLCAEPPAIDGIDLIVQTLAVSDTLVSVWVQAQTTFDYIIAQAACKSKFGREEGRGGRNEMN